MLAGCADCEYGWRYTEPAYVEALFPLGPGATPAQVESVEWLRRVYPTHVFPCASCRKPAFDRWKNGCMRPGHDAGGCSLCRVSAGKKVAAVQEPVDRPRPRDHTESRTTDDL